jgi:hypothetical protein
MLPKIALAFLVILIVAACKKSQSTRDPNDISQNTPAQNALLIQGNWIEDSINLTTIGTINATAPSYLNIDSDLNYTMIQNAVSNNPINLSGESDTGRFIFWADRFIAPISTGGNNYLGYYGLLEITVANAHHLVLNGGGDVVLNPMWYYHK